MSNTAEIEIKNQDIRAAFTEFFKSILQKKDVSAILVPKQVPVKNTVMPMLISDPEKLDNIDPIAPVFPINAGKLVSKLSRKGAGKKIAVVLRSCEVRALIELVKLKQANLDEIVLIGIDCLGAYKTRDYFKFVKENSSESSMKFYKDALQGNYGNISTACKACEYPVPDNVDILIGFIGLDSSLLVKTITRKGEELLKDLNLNSIEEPLKRKEAVDNLIEKRTAYRDKMFEDTKALVNNIENLTQYLAGCINCYNCRVACPVCYCRECVFVTDVFDHEPSQYLKWAQRKGQIKMPTDTLFYHITRIAHISTACIGCGQCSNVCPNDIPVTELFRTAAWTAQKAFDYQAGKSLDQAPPLSEFCEDEFSEIVGIN